MSIKSKQLKRVKELAFEFAKERDPDARLPVSGEPILTEANRDLDARRVLDPIQSQLTYLWCTEQDAGRDEYDDVVYFLANLSYYELSSKALVGFGTKKVEEITGCDPSGAGLSVHDFGGGSGLTTLDMCLRWPKADIHFSDVEGTLTSFARRLKDEFKLDNLHIEGINLKAGNSYFPEVDVSFALDVFEHIREPVPVARQLLRSTRKVYVDNSSFGTAWVGHYPWYVHNGDRLMANVSRTRTGRLKEQTFADKRPVGIKDVFFDFLDQDFELVDSGFNSVPSVYRRRV